MTEPNSTLRQRQEELVRALDKLSANWGWFMALGIAQGILGIIALGHVFAATLVSVLFIGVLMMLGGVGQLVQAWRIKHWSGFLLWTLGGVLYLVAGFIAVTNPVVGASLLTLLFGATLIGVGALRLWIWFNNRSQRGWQWVALSGFLTVAVGLLIAINWPANSAWVLGLLLGIDLLFHGWTVFFVSLTLRDRHKDKL
ncbi:MAG TPA: HdeD family acid-resistance protein [Burkholderiaceae bacterium]|nr:HdeD family acid-resistance protein [Burkholderiaceae bacterium]